MCIVELVILKELRTKSLTLLSADDHDRGTELKPSVSIGIECSGGTLHTGTSLEVDGVQCDGLGVSEEGVGVHFSYGAGDSIGSARGTNHPAVLSHCVIDVLH